MPNKTDQDTVRPRTMISRRMVLAGAAAMALSACAAIDEKKREITLTERVKQYTKAIRWGDFDIATRFLRRRDGSAVPANGDQLRGVRVTHYDYEIAAPSPEATEATMKARFDYQRPSSATVRRLERVATWWYDDATKNWFLDDGLPKF